ncbi:hypothetical protein LSTR_LSTR014975, partial [Laodelphax striatellus]
KDVNGEDKSKTQGSVDIVSAAIMAKVLEERERERQQQKHCDTCTCLVAGAGAGAARHHKATQTADMPQLTVRNGAVTTANNSSSPMAIRSKFPVDDRKSKACDFSALATERVSNWCEKDSMRKVHSTHDFSNSNLIGFNDLWSKTATEKTDKVREGILVNIDSGIESSDSSINKSSNEDRFTASANQKLDVGSDVADECDKASSSCRDQQQQHPPIYSGARHCSVRLQAGTSNILLDNVVDPYTPVLYKSRPASDHTAVHISRSRSTSSNSSIDESTNMLSNKRTIAQIRTETEI